MGTKVQSRDVSCKKSIDLRVYGANARTANANLCSGYRAEDECQNGNAFDHASKAARPMPKSRKEKLFYILRLVGATRVRHDNGAEFFLYAVSILTEEHGDPSGRGYSCKDNRHHHCHRY